MTADRGLSGPHLARLLGEWRSGGPAYAALARALRLLVLDGRLPLRTRVPGERELAEALGVSRTTATAAYAALREEGFLASRRGAGSWTRLPADPGAAPGPQPSTGDDVIDLSCAATAAPERDLHAALATATAELPRHLPGPGYDAAGLPVLREAIAAHLTRLGTPTTPDQILVTAGALHALTLLLRVLSGPGDRVVVEHPTYAAALDAVRASGARPVPVPMLHDGWDLEMLAATFRQAAPGLAYLIADHQNPTGLSMSQPDREQLVRLARATRTPLVVDEAIVGLHLDAPPERSVAALDEPGETVITIGSMSKTFWAGLRIGWVRANPSLIARLAAARAALDISSPVLEQLMAVALLEGAESILERQREAARARRGALLDALRTQLPEWRFATPPGGLCLWVELDAPRSTALAALADRHGVRLGAGPRFGVDGAFERYVRIPYSLPPDTLRDVVDRLALAWRGVTAGAVPAAEPAPALVA
ncbi:PLP-dependent aminotransferase family protein [Solirubrobacter sp. CPCC 204708]|uniref:PLP-dependent aminotransferase family protein n=1 Tax=Solirubrobacter deserti TaxID=2282478 RepID=A0ABT4RR91_9ACTN|nr:PLP-dependent aminotransferase family protein [Solirubrobacter deserti]MBE2314857.1 PLP-dependent aminotransferase family protein [Solirubrobacter deserti]MDA0141084.1 PLP-dependent aminotransferase family protein [Solirubrobacter deserti]